MSNTSELNEESSEGVKISDKRRIDPETGQPRVETGADQSANDVADLGLDKTSEKIAELTSDLQRITAEYAN